MDLTYQMMEQITAASTTGQTGAKRNAGTQNESDGGFETMVRQLRRENGESTGTVDPGTDTGAARDVPAEEETGTGEDRLAMAAAMLLQPQPRLEIVYAQDAEPAADTEAGEIPAMEAAGALPGAAMESGAAEAPEIALTAPETREAVEIPEAREAPEAAEAREAPETIGAAAPKAPTEIREAPEAPSPARADRPAEVFAAEPEKPAREPEQAGPAAAVTETPETADPELPAVALERESEDASLPADTRRDEKPGDTIGNTIENVRIETPVFGQLYAAPVKVGAPEPLSQPLDLEAEDAAEALGARIEGLLTDGAGNTRVELSLTPASLGRLTVEIARGTDGSLHVTLSAGTERAAALLEKNARGLQNLLSAGDRPQAAVSVRGGESARQEFLDPNGRDGRERQQQQRQQQQRRQPRQEALRVEDFMSRLRLGLVSLDAVSGL